VLKLPAQRIDEQVRHIVSSPIYFVLLAVVALAIGFCVALARRSDFSGRCAVGVYLAIYFANCAFFCHFQPGQDAVTGVLKIVQDCKCALLGILWTLPVTVALCSLAYVGAAIASALTSNKRAEVIRRPIGKVLAVVVLGCLVMTHYVAWQGISGR
jgi:hypothetical protein